MKSVMSAFRLASLIVCVSGVSSAKPSKVSKVGVLEKAEQVSEVPVVYSPKYKISLMGLEKLHPFDIGKYDKIYKELVAKGWLEKAHTPDPVTDKELLLVHTQEYLDELKKSRNVARYLEAPVLKSVPPMMMRRNVVNRFKLASGGTIEAARLALKKGFAVNLGGGYHHAKPTKGEGFCLFADVPIAIKVLQQEKKIKRALIIDTDVHQGNGTILCLDKDPTTFTFSIHEKDIYPMPKEKGDWDVELEGGTGDEVYLAKLKKCLPKLFQRSKPDIVFHVAGCDALAGDPLATMQMTHAGIAKRDKMIAEACAKRKIPYVMTLSGGYSKGAWKAQCKGIAEVMKVAAKKK